MSVGSGNAVAGGAAVAKATTVDAINGRGVGVDLSFPRKPTVAKAVRSAATTAMTPPIAVIRPGSVNQTISIQVNALTCFNPRNK